MPAKEQMRAAGDPMAATANRPLGLPTLRQYSGRVGLARPARQQLLDYCQQNLATDVAPAALVMVDAIPTTEEGNIDVEKLPPPGIASINSFVRRQ